MNTLYFLAGVLAGSAFIGFLIDTSDSRYAHKLAAWARGELPPESEWRPNDMDGDEDW